MAYFYQVILIKGFCVQEFTDIKIQKKKNTLHKLKKQTSKIVPSQKKDL